MFLQVDDIATNRTITNRQDLSTSEVFNSSDEFTNTLGERSVNGTNLGEDGAVLPARDLLDDGVHEVEDRFRGVGITSLDDGAILVETTVASNLLVLRVVVDVGNSDAEFIIVITTIKGGDGEVRTLSSVDFIVSNTIEGTADTRLLCGGTRFTVVVAAGDGHGDTDVVATRLVPEFNGFEDTVVTDGTVIGTLDLIEVLAHTFRKITESLDVLSGEEVLRDEGGRVGTDTDTRGTRGLVDVDDDSLETLEVVLSGGEETRGSGISGSGGFPELFTGVGEPVRLRSFKEELFTTVEGFTDLMRNIAAAREVSVVTYLRRGRSP